MIFFGDQAWFYLSARDALLTGRLPLLGITSSIVWLHQGPLWTYLLIPALALSRFHPLSGSILVVFFNFLAAILLYFLAKYRWNRKAGLIAFFLFVFNPYAKIYFSLAYHTSAIPLFTLVFFWCLVKRWNFLTGLFLGFLYQLHLLTFILWPLVLPRPRLSLIIGFLIGILPFSLSGPVQTFGIFAWIAKHLITGFSGTTPFSEAYLMVVLIPVILAVTWFLFRLPRIIILTVILLLIIGHWALDIDNYGPPLSVRISLARQILNSSRTTTPDLVMSGPDSRFSTSSHPYTYLTWWQSHFHSPAGTHSRFLIDETSVTFRMIQ